MNDTINVTKEVNMVWSIANKLRGPYKSDKYKDVIIPMIIITEIFPIQIWGMITKDLAADLQQNR